MLLQDRWLLPEGIEEILPSEAKRLERLRRQILDLFALWGYELVQPPLIDFIDSLLVGAGRELDLQTFKFTDQLSGRLLGVRADMTPQVARIDAHHLKKDTPTRLCYLGTVLHTKGESLEKSRNPMQVGAEIYGHESLESDLEIIRLMLEMLATTGIQDVHLDLGHVGIFRGLAEQAELNAVQEANLFDVLQRKATRELNEMLCELQLDETVHTMLAGLMEMNGIDGIIENANKVFKFAEESVKIALAELERVANSIRFLFPAMPINFDLAELRGYHYQTGLVFAAFVPGCGREIARGGRYDNVGQEFGRARPATGFSADLKVLSGIANDIPVSDAKKVFAPFEVDNGGLRNKIRDLRASGWIVIEELPGQQGNGYDMNCGYQLKKQGADWEVKEL
ncbi:MAG: ATP phosphoribosyltransferase regulatory subunit [Methylococcales bacterium]